VVAYGYGHRIGNLVSILIMTDQFGWYSKLPYDLYTVLASWLYISCKMVHWELNRMRLEVVSNRLFRDNSGYIGMAAPSEGCSC